MRVALLLLSTAYRILFSTTDTQLIKTPGNKIAVDKPPDWRVKNSQ